MFAKPKDKLLKSEDVFSRPIEYPERTATALSNYLIANLVSYKIDGKDEIKPPIERCMQDFFAPRLATFALLIQYTLSTILKTKVANKSQTNSTSNAKSKRKSRYNHSVSCTFRTHDDGLTTLKIAYTNNSVRLRDVHPTEIHDIKIKVDAFMILIKHCAAEKIQAYFDTQANKDLKLNRKDPKNKLLADIVSNEWTHHIWFLEFIKDCYDNCFREPIIDFILEKRQTESKENHSQRLLNFIGSGSATAVQEALIRDKFVIINCFKTVIPTTSEHYKALMQYQYWCLRTFRKRLGKFSESDIKEILGKIYTQHYPNNFFSITVSAAP